MVWQGACMGCGGARNAGRAPLAALCAVTWRGAVTAREWACAARGGGSVLRGVPSWAPTTDESDESEDGELGGWARLTGALFSVAYIHPPIRDGDRHRVLSTAEPETELCASA
jgi:hypothetical protein